MILSGIPSKMLADAMLWVAPAINKMAAGSNGKFFPADIIEAVRSEHMQLWVIHENGKLLATILTEVMIYPRRKALRFIGCVGKDWRTWAHLLPKFEEWGREHGCDLAEPVAPRRWRHLFPGYVESHVMMAKDI